MSDNEPSIAEICLANYSAQFTEPREQPITYWQFLRELNETTKFQTREGKCVGPASNSELKRWCQNKAVIVDGKAVAWDEVVVFPIPSFVLFPKRGRITMW